MPSSASEFKKPPPRSEHEYDLAGRADLPGMDDIVNKISGWDGGAQNWSTLYSTGLGLKRLRFFSPRFRPDLKRLGNRPSVQSWALAVI